LARATPKTPHKPAAKVRLDRPQRITWLRLIRTENVGPAVDFSQCRRVAWLADGDEMGAERAGSVNRL